jgi:penicillin-binding protein 2
MADMMAMIVNDGIVYRPHVLKEMRDPVSGAVSRIIKPEAILDSRMSKATFETIRENLRGVISEGTAKFPVNTKAVEVAGKTGTAEVGLRDHWHSWFASFAPYNYTNPNDVIVVIVMVEASNQWEWWAPYASNIIYQAVFAHQTYDEAIDALGLRYLVPKQQGRVE